MSFPLLPDIASRSRRFQLGETSETVPSLGVFRTSARAATRCAPLRSARRRPGSCDAPERARVRPPLALPALVDSLWPEELALGPFPRSRCGNRDGKSPLRLTNANAHREKM